MKSRRDFLKFGILATVSAASVATTAQATPVPAPKKYDMEYDLVIVGGGNAGLSAAAHGAEKGLKVLLLEKMPFVGGSSQICGGSWAASGSQMQKDAGIEDSKELFVKDMLTTGKNQNDPALVNRYVDETNKEYEFLLENGIKAHDVHAAGGMSVPRVHAFTPPEVVKFYKDYAEKHGAKILTKAPAERLLWNDETGKVEGVKFTHDGKTLTAKGKYGVLLASGGFAQNPELLGKYVPAMANSFAVAGKGNTGDGLKMGQSMGADVLDTNYIKATYGFKPNGGPDEKSYIYYNGGIIVNKDGKRFVDESLSYKLIGDKALEQPEAKTFTVFDNGVRKAGMAADRREIPFWENVDKDGTSPIAFVGKTLKEAAEKAGIPYEALKETIDKYNATAPSGNDELGRKTLSGGVGKPVPLTEGPWVIMPATAAMIATYCGLKVNPDTQVIDVFGEPIPGLYAAGEITGGFHGAAYMTGTAFSKAAAFGRVAAEQAVKEKEAEEKAK